MMITNSRAHTAQNTPKRRSKEHNHTTSQAEQRQHAWHGAQPPFHAGMCRNAPAPNHIFTCLLNSSKHLYLSSRTVNRLSQTYTKHSTSPTPSHPIPPQPTAHKQHAHQGNIALCSTAQWGVQPHVCMPLHIHTRCCLHTHPLPKDTEHAQEVTHPQQASMTGTHSQGSNTSTCLRPRHVADMQHSGAAGSVPAASVAASTASTTARTARRGDVAHHWQDCSIGWCTSMAKQPYKEEGDDGAWHQHNTPPQDAEDKAHAHVHTA